MDVKLMGIANGIMEQFQNEGLNYKQVDNLLLCIGQRVNEAKRRDREEEEKKPFRAIFF